MKRKASANNKIVEAFIYAPTTCNRITSFTEIASIAMSTGRSVYDIVLEKGYLTKAELDDALSPENMTRPRYLHRREDLST